MATDVNRSEFCRDHINKVGLSEASVESMEKAWKKAGHPVKDTPSSSLFYQQTKKIRDRNKARGVAAAQTRAAKKLAADAKNQPKVETPKAPTVTATGPDLIAIERQLEELMQQASTLKSGKLRNALLHARRQAGADILAAQ
tara:strand:- start:2278 stop:2703 length:426 start_codon:yes stop_codon:yes gene_type:complete